MITDKGKIQEAIKVINALSTMLDRCEPVQQIELENGIHVSCCYSYILVENIHTGTCGLATRVVFDDTEDTTKLSDIVEALGVPPRNTHYKNIGTWVSKKLYELALQEDSEASPLTLEIAAVMTALAMKWPYWGFTFVMDEELTKTKAEKALEIAKKLVQRLKKRHTTAAA